MQQAGYGPAPTPGDVEAKVEAKVEAILRAAGDRIKVSGDILDCDEFFTPDDRLDYDEKALDKRIRKADAGLLLGRFKDRLAEAEPFEPETLERLMHEFVEAEGIKIGRIIHAVRVAVTGKPVGLGMFDTLAILGRESCVARIDRALGRL